MNCCSPDLFKFKSIPRVIEKCVATRRLKKKSFLDNSEKFPENKSMAESVFSKASRKITL